MNIFALFKKFFRFLITEKIDTRKFSHRGSFFFYEAVFFSMRQFDFSAKELRRNQTALAIFEHCLYGEIDIYQFSLRLRNGKIF
jgi:hypothetical protein